MYWLVNDIVIFFKNIYFVFDKYGIMVIIVIDILLIIFKYINNIFLKIMLFLLKLIFLKIWNVCKIKL